MGIGNTTAAGALHAALLGVPAAAVCGPGTGLDPDGVRRKAKVIERALAANGRLDDPVDVLAALGGFEIAFLAGVALGAAAERLAVVLDGFIVTAAALVAARLEPAAVAYMVAGHLSPEPGHRLGLGRARASPSARPRAPARRGDRRRARAAAPSSGARAARGDGDLRPGRGRRMRAVEPPLAAVAFLTRIPVGRLAELDGAAVRRAAPLFPLVGGAIGALGGGVVDVAAGPLPSLARGRARPRRRSAPHRRAAPRRARRHRGRARRDDQGAAARDHARPRDRGLRRGGSRGRAAVRGVAARLGDERVERVRRCSRLRALGRAAARRVPPGRARRKEPRSRTSRS